MAFMVFGLFGVPYFHVKDNFSLRWDDAFRLVEELLVNFQRW